MIRSAAFHPPSSPRAPKHSLLVSCGSSSSNDSPAKGVEILSTGSGESTGSHDFFNSRVSHGQSAVAVRISSTVNPDLRAAGLSIKKLLSLRNRTHTIQGFLSGNTETTGLITSFIEQLSRSAEDRGALKLKAVRDEERAGYARAISTVKKIKDFATRELHDFGHSQITPALKARLLANVEDATRLLNGLTQIHDHLNFLLEKTDRKTSVASQVYQIAIQAIKGHSFIKGERLGAGSFGVVKKMTLGDLQLAVKTPFPDDNSIKYLTKEMWIQSLFPPHPNILPPSLFKFTEGLPEIVIPLKEDTLKTLAKKRTPLARKLNIIKGILKGLAHLHSYDIIHKDLSPGNILCNKDGSQAQIADFGLSELLEDSHACAATPSFSAPEVFGADGIPQTAAVDMWALGGLLFHLLTGDKIFNLEVKTDADSTHLAITMCLLKNETCNKIIQKLGTASLPLLGITDGNSLDSDTLDEIKTILLSLLNTNPNERASAKEILNTPLFNPRANRTRFLQVARQQQKMFQRVREIKSAEKAAYLARVKATVGTITPVFHNEDLTLVPVSHRPSQHLRRVKIAPPVGKIIPVRSNRIHRIQVPACLLLEKPAITGAGKENKESKS